MPVARWRSRFIRFVVERESIRLRRARGEPAPWTDDPILNQFRFTNVRRRDDRVSIWLCRRVYTHPLFTSPSLAAVQFVALCRQINWPPTIEALMLAGMGPAPRLDLKAMGKAIDLRARSGKAWTGAYMIRAEPGDHPKGEFILENVVGRALAGAWVEIDGALRAHTRRGVWEGIAGSYGWGSFMAGQVVDDLTWTPILRNPIDDFTWAPIGPGSLRGLNRILGRPRSFRLPKEEWCVHLRRFRLGVVEALGPDYEDLTLMDVQNCLCEFDKYERVRLGEGRPRALYRPETAY